MTETGDALVARVRDVLSPVGAVREVSMFGGLAFLVDDRMVVSVGRKGSLLVRIDPGRAAELLSLPGAEPAVMGADRPMGPGWITVTTDGLATDEQLGQWIGIALQHHGGAKAAD